MTKEKALNGKTAIVTGASSGIGRAIAESCGAAGAHVVLAGRTRGTMEASQRRIVERGGKATVAVVDVRDARQVDELVRAAESETGRLDIMVNNAGISYATPIIDGDPEEWRSMLETNVLGLLVGCRAAVRAMRACKAEGHIVNLSSVATQRPDSGVYGATKCAVNCISRTLRRELENDTIRVINVSPGFVATNAARHDTAFLTTFSKLMGAEQAFQPGQHVPDELLNMVQSAMKEVLGAPEDVANSVLFAVTQPIHVNIFELEVRPAKHLTPNDVGR